MKAGEGREDQQGRGAREDGERTVFELSAGGSHATRSRGVARVPWISIMTRAFAYARVIILIHGYKYPYYRNKSHPAEPVQRAAHGPPAERDEKLLHGERAPRRPHPRAARARPGDPAPNS